MDGDSPTQVDLSFDGSDAEIRSVPQSREAEEAVLGSILINPEKYLEVAQIIEPDDFFIQRNKWVWLALRELSDMRRDIDIQTVADVLESQNRLQESGGKNYLHSLIGKTPFSTHADSYANIIAEKSLRRRLIDAAGKVSDLAFNNKEKLDSVLSKSEKAIFDVAERRETKEIRPINLILNDVYDRIRILYHNKEDIAGVPTGFKDFDKLTGGLHKSDLIIVAARPGMGKTGFMLSVLKNTAVAARKHVAMFSLEMSNEQMIHRLISQITGINSQKLRSGQMADDELPLFIDAVDVLGDTKVFLDDTPGITPMQLRSKCRRLHYEHHLDLIIIDYLQLMSGDIYKDNRVQEVSYISRNLKILARELNVPVLTAAQLSRGVEQRADKLPMLSDLRESGSLEQDADIVMFLHDPNTGESKISGLDGAVKLIVAKHRHGPVGDIDLVFIKKLARFEDAARISDYGGAR